MKTALLALCVATLVAACAKSHGTPGNAATTPAPELTSAADELPSADDSPHEARLRWLARPMSATGSLEKTQD